MSDPQPLREIERKYRTCPQDARYQNMNMTNWCYATYVDFKKCQRLLGEKGECCSELEKIYKSLCPHAWVSRWEEQIKDGTFPADLPPLKK